MVPYQPVTGSSSCRELWEPVKTSGLQGCPTQGWVLGQLHTLCWFFLQLSRSPFTLLQSTSREQPELSKSLCELTLSGLSAGLR